ncbi:hypothetical protein [Agitococcus lubricus]|uniref:Uncharacterized protein n=1 Tax=Agitococcus lubricus TaxID=1077255 RepID=A0A2T5IZQ8_9GAMM|nr:hypothetical protein [Agitococcus lubricus]PTQ89525.1 hypothetical protein C8N29_10656 [Agitococcus lubricus]
MAKKYNKRVCHILASVLSTTAIPVYALDALNDESLGEVAGQDGIQLMSVASQVTAERAYWQEDGRELQLRSLSITPKSVSDFTLATIGVDIGSSTATASGTPAVSINVVVPPITLSFGQLCVTAANAANCGVNGASNPKTMGELALLTNQNSTISFFNTNGFFDSTSSNARIRVNINDAELYLAQTFNGRRSLAILDNLIINSRFDGKFAIDATEGIRAQGTLSLIRSGLNNGFQFDISHNEGIPTGFTNVGSKGMLRVGISGTINNFDFRMRPDNSLMGSGSGIKISTSGILSSGNFALELSEAGNGTGADGIRFSQWVDFSNGAAISPSSPYISLGDMYLNLLGSGVTVPALTSPVSSLAFSPWTTVDNALFVAVRDLNFQAYAKVISFFDVDTNVAHAQNWAFISTLHDLDANLVMMGGGHPSLAAAQQRGIGFDMQLTTKGRNASGTEGTHILVADPAVGTYLGWRNVNLAAEIRQGQLYVADTVNDGVNGIRISAESLKLSASGQFAVGQLPDGGSITSMPTTGHGFGLAIDIESGSGTHLTFSPPTSGNYLGFSGSLRFGDTPLDGDTVNSNSITLSEPSSTGGNSPRFQYGDITGRIDIVNGKIDTVSDALNDSITFEYTLDISPDAGIYTANDVQVITGGASPQTYRFGQLVIPSGQLYTKLTLKPQ